jgi:hypothetical protein
MLLQKVGRNGFKHGVNLLSTNLFPADFVVHLRSTFAGSLWFRVPTLVCWTEGTNWSLNSELLDPNPNWQFAYEAST